MLRRRVIRPEILPQRTGPVTSKEDAAGRGFTAGQNTSSFFTHTYKAMEGGRTPPLNNGYVSITFPWDEKRYFRPDLVHKRNSGWGYTEVKAVSTHTSQYHCSPAQLENYAFSLLFRKSSGDEVPWVDYAFFRYGDHNFTGQYKLSNGNLVSSLAGATRDLLIAPFNLTLFMLMNSPERWLNQESSGSTVSERAYWDIRSSLLNILHQDDHSEPFQIIMDRGERMREASDRLRKSILEDLMLTNLRVKRTTSPEMHTARGTSLKPFSITKYRLPNGDYQEWLNHFAQNHERILKRVGARDLFGELEEHGTDSVVFGKRASYIADSDYSPVPF